MNTKPLAFCSLIVPRYPTSSVSPMVRRPTESTWYGRLSCRRLEEELPIVTTSNAMCTTPGAPEAQGDGGTNVKYPDICAWMFVPKTVADMVYRPSRAQAVIAVAGCGMRSSIRIGRATDRRRRMLGEVPGGPLHGLAMLESFMAVERCAITVPRSSENLRRKGWRGSGCLLVKPQPPLLDGTRPDEANIARRSPPAFIATLT